MLGLVVVEGKSRGAHFVLSGDVARLGRDPTCEVPLDDELLADELRPPTVQLWCADRDAETPPPATEPAPPAPDGD